MTAAARNLVQPATMADLEALPPSMKGELIDGVLYAMTRPRGRHQSVAGRVHSDYEPAYERGRGGPGGWWILSEPGIELPGAPEISPDVAGWRRERLPALPPDAPIRVVPDWVCEVLSPSTRRYNMLVKSPYYARVGVAWMWLVDNEAMVVTAHKLHEGQWLEVGVYSEETDARIAPFADVAVDVASWWPVAP
jgi:Uma2 family endonuclease